MKKIRWSKHTKSQKKIYFQNKTYRYYSRLAEQVRWQFYQMNSYQKMMMAMMISQIHVLHDLEKQIQQQKNQNQIENRRQHNSSVCDQLQQRDNAPAIADIEEGSMYPYPCYLAPQVQRILGKQRIDFAATSKTLQMVEIRVRNHNETILTKSEPT